MLYQDVATFHTRSVPRLCSQLYLLSFAEYYALKCKVDKSENDHLARCFWRVIPSCWALSKLLSSLNPQRTQYGLHPLPSIVVLPGLEINIRVREVAEFCEFHVNCFYFNLYIFIYLLFLRRLRSTCR